MGDLSDMMPGQSDNGGIKWGHFATGAAIGYGLGHQIRNLGDPPELREFQQGPYIDPMMMNNPYHMQQLEREYNARMRAVGIMMLIKMLILWGIIGFVVWLFFFSG